MQRAKQVPIPSSYISIRIQNLMIIDYSGLLIQEFILSHAKIDKGMGRFKQPGSFQALVG